MVPLTGPEYTMEYPVETPGGNSPPECCIYMGSSPSPLDTKKENPGRGSLFWVPVTGLEYTMEHPAETPGGNSPPDCCISMGSSPAMVLKNRGIPRGCLCFWCQ